MNAWLRSCPLVVVLLLSTAVTAEQPIELKPDAVIADFDRGLPTDLATVGIAATHQVDAATNSGSLHLSPAEHPAGVVPAVFLPLPGSINPAATGGISLSVKGQAAGGKVRIRLGLCDDKGRLILQRSIIADTDGTWRPTELALSAFRWGDVAGGWGEARAVRIAVETPFESLDFDNLRLTPPAAPPPAPHERIARAAFPGKNVRMVRTSTLLLATDVEQGRLSDAGLMHILGNMIKAEALVKRLFANGVRRVDDPAPVSLLIFSDAADCTAYWRRRGDAWNVGILVPSWGAYTVQDVATAVFDPATGADRPTFVHEAIHAVAARELRIIPGATHHGWLQEGLANYVQLSLYPASFDAKLYPQAFELGTAEAPERLFLPLQQLLTQPISGERYAQVASLTAFLAERHADWLAVIARELADGQTIDHSLGKCGTDVAKLEKEWLEWGRARFKTERKDGHFEKPAEWMTTD